MLSEPTTGRDTIDYAQKPHSLSPGQRGENSSKYSHIEPLTHGESGADVLQRGGNDASLSSRERVGVRGKDASPLYERDKVAVKVHGADRGGQDSDFSSENLPACNFFQHPTNKPLILGVGNLLMGDEGVGVAAIRHLEAKGFTTHAELVDGGTGGFHLLGYFRDRRHIILIDAAADNRPIGTVSLIQPRYASDFPPSLTAHDIGLKDLLESAALLGDLPHVDLITISVGNLGALSMDLSPVVAATLPEIQRLVVACLQERLS